MDGGPISDPRSRLGGGGDVILRVSPPWPGRTEGLLRASLDKGTFEDFHLTISPGPASTKYLVYFAGAADEGVGSPFSRGKSKNYRASELILDDSLPVCRSNSTYQHYAETSLLTLVTNTRILSLSRSSHRLVGRLSRTICTQIVSASSRPDCKAPNQLEFAVPQICSSAGTHAHRGRYFIWLTRFEDPPRRPTVVDTIETARCVRGPD